MEPIFSIGLADNKTVPYVYKHEYEYVYVYKYVGVPALCLLVNAVNAYMSYCIMYYS